MYIPPWPGALSGPVPPMPQVQPAPLAPMPAPPGPVAPPAAPPHFFSQAYPPGGWAPIPNYFLAPTQPYLIGYPPTPWPPYQQYYAGQQGTFNKHSKTAKPNKFTGQEPSKLYPFIISCIMAFNCRPCKFSTNCQCVSYATSYLSNITMIWWQLTLVTYPKLSIWGD